MTRTETTAALSRLVVKRIRTRLSLWAPEVEVTGGGIVDYMGFNIYGDSPDAAAMERGTLVCLEVKSCLDDFRSGHGLNFVGDENWLVCPRDLCEELRRRMMFPPVAGVLCPDSGWNRLVEAVHLPSPSYMYRRQMTAAEAVWRIAKASYGARFEAENREAERES